MTLGLDVLASGGLEDFCRGDSGSPGAAHGVTTPAGVTDLHVRLDRDVAVYDLSAARVAAMPELVGRGRNAST